MTTKARSHEAGPNLHRNNAAEWVLWLAICPAVLLLRLGRAATSIVRARGRDRASS